MEDEIASDLDAVKNMTWEDWSGTDDDEEVDTYFCLDTEPWRQDEEEERRRTQQAGVAEVNMDHPQKPTPPPPLVKCNLCSATFTTLDGYIKHRVGHGMQGKARSFVMKNCQHF